MQMLYVARGGCAAHATNEICSGARISSIADRCRRCHARPDAQRLELLTLSRRVFDVLPSMVGTRVHFSRTRTTSTSPSCCTATAAKSAGDQRRRSNSARSSSVCTAGKARGRSYSTTVALTFLACGKSVRSRQERAHRHPEPPVDGVCTIQAEAVRLCAAKRLTSAAGWT
jgi:hypothetical protein